MKFGLFYNTHVPKPLEGDEWPPGLEAQRFQEALEQLELADRLGFDYTFMTEHHHLSEYSHMPAPDVMLAAASQRTKRMRLGTGIVQLLPQHNRPARIAERLSLLDILSGGRVEFGGGAGSAVELRLLGLDPDKKEEMRREGMREVLRMMATNKYPGFTGDYFEQAEAYVLPKPVQRPHPPVWMASTRMDLTVESAHLGIASFTIAVEGPKESEARVTYYWDAIREHCEPVGLAVNPGVSGVVFGLVGESDDQAMERGEEGVAYYGYALKGIFFDGPSDHRWREFMEERDEVYGSSDLVEKLASLGSRDFIENRQETLTVVPEDARRDPSFFLHSPGTLLGSPATVAEKVRAYEEAGIDLLIIAMQLGNTRHEHIMDSIRLFATEVMPEFQDRHVEHVRWRADRLKDVRADVPIISSLG